MSQTTGLIANVVEFSGRAHCFADLDASLPESSEKRLAIEHSTENDGIYH